MTILGEPKWAPGILNWSLTKIDQVAPKDHVHSGKSLKDFFKQAWGKGSKCNKDIVNSKEIKKKL